jgi:hypothetical protein
MSAISRVDDKDNDKDDPIASKRPSSKKILDYVSHPPQNDETQQVHKRRKVIYALSSKSKASTLLSPSTGKGPAKRQVAKVSRGLQNSNERTGVSALTESAATLLRKVGVKPTDETCNAVKIFIRDLLELNQTISVSDNDVDLLRAEKLREEMAHIRRMAVNHPDTKKNAPRE